MRSTSATAGSELGRLRAGVSRDKVRRDGWSDRAACSITNARERTTYGPRPLGSRIQSVTPLSSVARLHDGRFPVFAVIANSWVVRDARRPSPAAQIVGRPCSTDRSVRPIITHS